MIRLSKTRIIKRSLLLTLGVVSLLGAIFTAAKMIKTSKVDAADTLGTVTIESPSGLGEDLPGWVMYKSGADPVNPPTLDGKTLINNTINLSTPHIGIMKPDGTHVDYDAYCLNPTLTAPNGEYNVVTMPISAQNNQVKLAVYLSSVYRNINNKFTADEQAPVNTIVASWFSTANPSTQKWNGTAGEYREQDEDSGEWHAVYDGTFPNITTTEGKDDYVYLMIHLAISYLLNGDIDNLYSTYMNYTDNNTQDKQDWDFINEILDTLSSSVEPGNANYDIWLKAQNYVLYGIEPKTTSEQNVVWIEDGNPAFGSIKVQKCDKETSACSPQGNASFQGITFVLYNASGSRIYVPDSVNPENGVYYDDGEIMGTGITGADGTYTFSGLPIGIQYKITETSTNASYLMPATADASQTSTIQNDGQTVTVKFYDNVLRGDVKFVKTSSEDGKNPSPMADVAFRITSKTTGENHIIVSDKNGEVNTATVNHTSNTNAYDNMDLAEIAYSSNIGTWFGTGSPNNSKGALPYDNYTITELECDANKFCYDIDSKTMEFSINEDTIGESTIIDLDSLDNNCAKLSLETIAVDNADGDKEILAEEGAVIKDTVSYCLKAGLTYDIVGVIMDKSTGEELLVDGKPVQSSVLITPEEDCGEAEMLFEFDASGLGGSELVIFEKAYYSAEWTAESDPDDIDITDGIEIVAHEDLNDEAQTILVVEPEAPKAAETGIVTKTSDTTTDGGMPIIIIASVSCAAIYLATRFVAKRKFLSRR